MRKMLDLYRICKQYGPAGEAAFFAYLNNLVWGVFWIGCVFCGLLAIVLELFK